MRRRCDGAALLLLLLLLCASAAVLCARGAAALRGAVVLEEFIFANATADTHASTIVELERDVLMAAWFGGSGEGHPDVAIYMSVKRGGQWSPIWRVVEPDGVACYNPALFQHPETGDAMLFFHRGINPREWSGYLTTSPDAGASWTPIRALPAGVLGPIKNKPYLHGRARLLCPSSVESWQTWACWVDVTEDWGRTWRKVGPIELPDTVYGMIQPAIFEDRARGGVRLVARTTNNVSRIVTAHSADGGLSWSAVERTNLPNPNSGIDAVALRDGHMLVVYNHATQLRSPLNVALSKDGVAWTPVLTLEDNPSCSFAYPAVIQARDDLVHITYSWQCGALGLPDRIKHVVLDPTLL